jgi:hypothetical protein
MLQKTFDFTLAFNVYLINAWTVKIGEGSGPWLWTPGSTTFSNFDDPGVIF